MTGYVRLEPNHCCDGLWNRDGRAIAADTLPIQDDLRERIVAWNSLWADLVWETDPMSEDSGDASRWADWRIEGRRLAYRLAKALPDRDVWLYTPTHGLVLVKPHTSAGSPR